MRSYIHTDEYKYFIYALYMCIKYLCCFGLAECQHARAEDTQIPKRFQMPRGGVEWQRGREKEGSMRWCVMFTGPSEPSYLAYFCARSGAIMMDVDVVFFTSRVVPAFPLPFLAIWRWCWQHH